MKSEGTLNMANIVGHPKNFGVSLDWDKTWEIFEQKRDMIWLHEV